jgi:hypothetical protein
VRLRDTLDALFPAKTAARRKEVERQVSEKRKRTAQALEAAPGESPPEMQMNI